MKKIVITFSDDIPIYAIRGMAKNIRSSYVDFLSVNVFTECASNTKEKTDTSPNKQRAPCPLCFKAAATSANFCLDCYSRIIIG
jgi:hypothetical protein